eukprot:g35865.t1
MPHLLRHEYGGRKGQNRISQTSTEKMVMLPRRRRRRERDGDGGRRRQRVIPSIASPGVCSTCGDYHDHPIFQAELRSILHSYIKATGQGITYSCITYEKCRVVNPINYSDGKDYSVYLSECTGDCVVIWKISCVSRLERMVLARVLYNLKRLWLLVYMFWAHLATCTVEAQRWETVGQLQTACHLMMLEREVPNCLGAMDGWSRRQCPCSDQPEATHRKVGMASRRQQVDGTFADSPVLQKPYPVAQLDLPSKLLFNKIHDSGIKVVEQAFGQVVDGLESLHSQYDGSLSLRPRTLPM